MPPKKIPSTDEAGGAASPTHGYSEGDIQIMTALLKHMPRPTYDADKIAEEVGSASGASVRKRVSNAAQKHGWFTGVAAECGSENGTPKTPRAKKTPSTGGRKKKHQPEDGEEDEAETPSKKKARTRKVKAEEAIEEEIEAKDAGEEAADGQI